MKNQQQFEEVKQNFNRLVKNAPSVSGFQMPGQPMEFGRSNNNGQFKGYVPPSKEEFLDKSELQLRLDSITEDGTVIIKANQKMLKPTIVDYSPDMDKRNLLTVSTNLTRDVFHVLLLFKNQDI